VISPDELRPLVVARPDHHGRLAVHPHSEIVELEQLKLQITGPQFGEDFFLRFDLAPDAGVKEFVVPDAVHEGRVPLHDRLGNLVLQDDQFVFHVSPGAFADITAMTSTAAFKLRLMPVILPFAHRDGANVIGQLPGRLAGLHSSQDRHAGPVNFSGFVRR
jgi:hypothetical protein